MGWGGGGAIQVLPVLPSIGHLLLLIQIQTKTSQCFSARWSRIEGIHVALGIWTLLDQSVDPKWKGLLAWMLTTLRYAVANMNAQVSSLTRLVSSCATGQERPNINASGGSYSGKKANEVSWTQALVPN